VPVFVDTNVWVYAVDEADPVKQARASAILAADAADVVVSTQVMSELYVTLRQKLRIPPARAADLVGRLSRLRVVAVEPAHVEAAMSLSAARSVSYWDALIIASAQAAHCDRLLTEDLADGEHYGDLRIENPFRDRPHRLAEAPVPWAGERMPSWTDADLRDALGRYEEACATAGMRRNAIHSYWDYARRFLDWREGAYRPRGTVGAGRPVPLRTVGVADLTAEASAYATTIAGAGRAVSTVDTYYRHALFFVRWLDGAFEPGGRLKRT
jgi:predicted nucleic acid-binding protein